MSIAIRKVHLFGDPPIELGSIRNKCQQMLLHLNDDVRHFEFCCLIRKNVFHYNDVIMSAMASQITSLPIVYSTVYPGADKIKHQSSVSLAFVRGIHR